jgi:hypothetical protein
MIASDTYSIYVDVNGNHEIDLDEKFGITCVKCVVFIAEDQQFYFVANKFQGVIGFFLIRYSVNNPDDYKFLTMWRQKMDIADVNLYVLRGTDPEQGLFKELIIGYKTIYINTYTVVV